MLSNFEKTSKKSAYAMIPVIYLSYYGFCESNTGSVFVLFFTVTSIVLLLFLYKHKKSWVSRGRSIVLLLLPILIASLVAAGLLAPALSVQIHLVRILLCAFVPLFGWLFGWLTTTLETVENEVEARAAFLKYGRGYDRNQAIHVGENYMSTGQYQKAIDEYTIGIDQNQNDGQMYYLRALSYERLGQCELAKKDREISLRLGYQPEPKVT